MKKFKSVTLIASSILLLSFCEGRSQTKIESKTEINTNNIIQTKYKLKGFKQSCCVGIVEYSLKEVKGIIKLKANMKDQELTVWFDITNCKEEEIKKAINKTSYKIVK